ANKLESHGWIGRYFDNACQGCDPTIGVNIGRQMPQAFASGKPVGVSLNDPQSYRFQSGDRTGMTEESYRELNQPDELAAMDADGDNSGGTIASISGAARHSGSALDFLERTAMDAQISSDKILAVSNKVQ